METALEPRSWWCVFFLLRFLPLPSLFYSCPCPSISTSSPRPRPPPRPLEEGDADRRFSVTDIGRRATAESGCEPATPPPLSPHAATVAACFAADSIYLLVL